MSCVQSVLPRCAVLKPFSVPWRLYRKIIILSFLPTFYVPTFLEKAGFISAIHKLRIFLFACLSYFAPPCRLRHNCTWRLWALCDLFMSKPNKLMQAANLILNVTVIALLLLLLPRLNPQKFGNLTEILAPKPDAYVFWREIYVPTLNTFYYFWPFFDSTGWGFENFLLAHIFIK